VILAATLAIAILVEAETVEEIQGDVMEEINLNEFILV
jgi:hypothetical protein